MTSMGKVNFAIFPFPLGFLPSTYVVDRKVLVPRQLWQLDLAADNIRKEQAPAPNNLTLRSPTSVFRPEFS